LRRSLAAMASQRSLTDALYAAKAGGRNRVVVATAG
jgi:PleD family two-component response regulator